MISVQHAISDHSIFIYFFSLVLYWIDDIFLSHSSVFVLSAWSKNKTTHLPKKNPKHCLLGRIRSIGINIHKYLVYLNGALCDIFLSPPSHIVVGENLCSCSPMWNFIMHVYIAVCKNTYQSLPHMLSSSRPTMLNERDYICIYSQRERVWEREFCILRRISNIPFRERVTYQIFIYIKLR